MDVLDSARWEIAEAAVFGVASDGDPLILNPAGESPMVFEDYSYSGACAVRETEYVRCKIFG